jgi:hypothetical protein
VHMRNSQPGRGSGYGSGLRERNMAIRQRLKTRQQQAIAHPGRQGELGRKTAIGWAAAGGFASRQTA